MARPRLVLADDHPEILDELHTLLVAEFEMAGCVTNGNELVRAVIELDPDVIITDVYMPGIDGIEASRAYSTTGSGSIGNKSSVRTTNQL